jgi:hypothetical protein
VVAVSFFEKELKLAKVSTEPSKAVMKGERRMEQAVRRALNCPKCFTKIGSSSGQANWCEYIFLSSGLDYHLVSQ